MAGAAPVCSNASAPMVFYFTSKQVPYFQNLNETNVTAYGRDADSVIKDIKSKAPDAGCTDWSSCSFELYNCTVNPRMVSAGNQWVYVLDYSPSLAIRKKGFDGTYKRACCAGAFSDNLQQQQLYCDPHWCPADPSGQCADVFTSTCFLDRSHADTTTWSAEQKSLETKYVEPAVNRKSAQQCAKSPLLSLDSTCNDWYKVVRDTSGHPSKAALQALMGEHCATFTGNGECACWNAVRAMPAEPVFVQLAGEYVRHVSVVPAGPGVTDAIPKHCYLRDCQANKDTCLFWDPFDMDLPCPDMCFQYVGGNRTSIGNINASVTVIDQALLTCSAGALPLDSVFSLSEANPELLWCMDTNVATQTSFAVVNVATDTTLSAAASQVVYKVFSSIPSVVSVLGGTNSRTLSGGDVATISLQLDTSSLTYAPIPGQITLVDQSGANLPLQVPFLLQVAPASVCSQGAAVRSAVRRQQQSGGWAWILIAVVIGIVALVLAGAPAWAPKPARPAPAAGPGRGLG